MSTWKPLGLFISAATLFLALSYFLLPSWMSDVNWKASSTSEEARFFQAPARNLWAELNLNEASQLFKYLYETPNGLNLTRSPIGSGVENYIGQVELLRPNKTDVVHHLDEAGHSPDRWARVTIAHGDGETTRMAEYMVGPLPPSNSTQVLPLTYPYNSGRNYVDTAGANGNTLLYWVMDVGSNVSDITEILLGGKLDLLHPTNPNSLFIGVRPVTIDSGGMVLWMEFFRAGFRSGAVSMLPQGLYVKAYTSGHGSDQWKIQEWYYNGVLYSDTDALRLAISLPNFTKSAINRDGSWTDLEDFHSHPPGRSKPPPLSVQPYGPRYYLDRKENYVSWMGFTFYVATAQATAVALFDIRFNDSRVIYHLGLQEALAHYAGSDPMQGGLGFFDTFYGMGTNMYSLVPGYDCPAYADYIDMTFYSRDQMLTNKNAICIFEFTSDAPLQRHINDDVVSISRNTYLILRSVSTVGNYDYTIDYLFYLDGSIEVKVRASGFIYTAFVGETDPNILKEYGYRVHDAAMTSIHDHVLNFRVDFDIMGVNNSFIRTSLVPHKQTYPWDKPEVESARHTMHLIHTPLEVEAGLDWPRNSESLYLIQSNAANKWGERKSYRIQPGTGIGSPAHLTIQNSTVLSRSAAWSTSDLFVLRNHASTEPSSAHALNYLTPTDPLIDFEAMLNSESIVNEDLVIYFNLGGHHVPNSHDIPNTLMHTSASSVVFSPFNYFDHDVSIASRQGVRVDRSDPDKCKQVRYFGGRYDKPAIKLDKSDLEPDLSNFLQDDEGAGEGGGGRGMRKNMLGLAAGLWGLTFGRQ